MKFLKLLTFLLLINNFAFSAETDKKASKEKEIYLFGKKLISKIKKTVEGQNISYEVTVVDFKNVPAQISCSKMVTNDKTDYACIIFKNKKFSLLGEEEDEEEREQDYFARLEFLYDQQNNEENSD